MGARCLNFWISLASLFLATAGWAGQPQDWKTYGLELNAESPEVVEGAKKSLLSIPDLDRVLTEALRGRSDTDRKAACEVIGKLHRKSLVPTLLEHARTDSERYVFEALFPFLPEIDHSRVAGLYSDRLSNASEHPLTAGSKVEILESFQKLDTALSVSQLEALLTDANPQVRIAALDLAGEYRVRRHLEQYDEPILQAIKMKPYQLRLDALRWLEQVPSNSPIRGKLGDCRNDPNNEVAELCRKLNAP